MTFFNTDVPLGWVQDTTNNDAMMRVVATVGGGVGGVVSPTTLNWAHTHTTGSLSLTIAQMPAHTHTYIGHISQRGASSGSAQDGLLNRETTSVGGGAAHNHGATSSAGNIWSPKYINIIIGTKS